jgi:hypothetical protein
MWVACYLMAQVSVAMQHTLSRLCQALFDQVSLRLIIFSLLFRRVPLSACSTIFPCATPCTGGAVLTAVQLAGPALLLPGSRKLRSTAWLKFRH